MENNSSTPPLISVIVTTFERPKLLLRALASIEKQNYDNIEIIIGDDCSQDDTEAKITQFKLHSRFRVIYFKNRTNKGACYTRNKAISLASGKFVTGLDDDDEFVNDRLSFLLENYKDEFSFVTSNTKVISKKGVKNLFAKKRIVTLHDTLWANAIGTQVFVKRERVLDVGGYDINLPSAQDADLWIRLIDRFGPALRLREPKYMLHTEHEMPRISTSTKKIEGMLKVLEKHKHLMTSEQILFRQLQCELYKGLRFPAILKIIFNRRISFYLIRRRLGKI